MFASVCLQELVLAIFGIKRIHSGLTLRCPFKMVLGSTETIVYCHLDWGVLAGQYAWRAHTNRDFALLNDKDFLSTKAWSWQTLWIVTVRAVVRLLSELLSKGFCQSGCCQSGCCHSGCCQSGCCQSGSQAGWQSKSVTKLLHLSVLVIYTAWNLPKRQPWDNPIAAQNPGRRIWKPKQRPRPWTRKRDPKPMKQPRKNKSADPKMESLERSQIN
jgi:hypothetical protein